MILIPPQVQQATLEFFGPVSAAWLAMCGTWLAVDRLWPRWWPRVSLVRPARPWCEGVLALAAAAAVLGLGAAYRAGWLLPGSSGAGGWLVFNANTLVIYAPVFAVLALRRQGFGSVFVDGVGVLRKLATGLALSLLGLCVYTGLRGEVHRVPGFIAEAVSMPALGFVLPVFLEGVAIAFLFVRLQWICGATGAVLVAALLFAAAHVPRAVEAGRPLGEIAAFLAFNTALPAVILVAVARSRDVLWLGVAHYVLDVAIDAFH